MGGPILMQFGGDVVFMVRSALLEFQKIAYFTGDQKAINGLSHRNAINIVLIDQISKSSATVTN